MTPKDNYSNGDGDGLSSVGIGRKDRIVRDTTKIWVSSIFLQLTAVLRGFVIPRILTPKYYGIIGGLTLIFTYGLYLDLGFLSATNREIPRLLGKEDYDSIEKIESTTITLTIITTLIYIIGLIIYGLIALRGWLTFISLLIFAFSFIPLRFSNFYKIIAESYKRFDIVSNFNIFNALTNLLIIIPLVLFFKFPGFLIALPISISINFAYIYLSRLKKIKIMFHLETAKRLFSIGFPLFLMGLGGVFLLTVDRLMIIHLSNTEQLGIYMIAVTISSFIYLLINNASRVLGPEIFNEWGRSEDKVSLLETAKKTLFPINMFTSILISLVVISFPIIFNVLLPKYSGARIPLVLLSAGIYMLGSVVSLWLVLIATNRQMKIFYFQLISLPISASIMYILFKNGMGLIGIAIGTTVGIIIYTTLVLFYSIWVCNRKLSVYFKFIGYMVLPLVYFGAVTTGVVIMFKTPELKDFSYLVPNLIVVLKRLVILISSSLPIFVVLQWKTGILTNVKNLFVKRKI